MSVQLNLVSPLEKCFADTAPKAGYSGVSIFQNETASFQVSLHIEANNPAEAESINCSWQLQAPGQARIRMVRQVPVTYTTLPNADENYLRKEGGLFPDVLEDITPCITLNPGMYSTLWIDIENAPAGRHTVTLRLYNGRNGELLAQADFSLQVLPHTLPKQTLIHTKWLHCDCLCQYYGVSMWSERFWEICEHYVRSMVKHGINMLLTPIHTPPLDTAVGGERMTCQLVDIACENGCYTFRFDKLRRWVDMAKRCGVEYYEMAHLFTQWGAKYAPKIIVKENGTETARFGWHTDGHGEAYIAFLQSYIPALRAELRNLGIEKRCYFHLSDEPSLDMLEDYRAAADSVRAVLDGVPIFDAMADVTFYQNGLIERPVVAINHIEPFLKENIPALWGYYCLGQYRDVPNVFVAMSGARTRILGVLLYKFRLEGFLQWGYNFYNAQYSTHPINPWVNTDCDGFAPAGDAFQVYPGSDGKPVESQRLMLIDQALYDLRALQALEALIGRERVMALVEEGIEPPRFSCYPKEAEWLLSLRERVNRAYAEASNATASVPT